MKSLDEQHDGLVSGGLLGYAPRDNRAEPAIVQCMGGWCGSREKCRHYRAHGTGWNTPVERLCGSLEEPLPLRGTDAQG